jgi:hypothetical protein
MLHPPKLVHVTTNNSLSCATFPGTCPIGIIYVGSLWIGKG